MKQSILGIGLLTCALSLNAQHSLTKLWTTDSTLKVPESVLFDEKNNVLYVANIDGQPAEKDGKGSIGKVGTDGKIISTDWVTGLNAPKGMALHQKTLWVADIDQVVAIDIESGSIKQQIPIEGSVFLNDVTADPAGNIYISDSETKKVHVIKNGTPSLYWENLQRPNGLLFHKNALLILDNGTLNELDKTKGYKKLAEGMEGGTDGIEHINKNDFIVSCWSGVIYYVSTNGKKEMLLDTRNEKINSADIGYDAKNKIVYVPTFWKNTVVAYQLK